MKNPIPLTGPKRFLSFIPRTRTDRKNRRLASLATAVFFALTTLTGEGVLWAQSIGFGVAGGDRIGNGKRLEEAVPANLGTLQDYFVSTSGKEAPFIIHIQDAHANPSAQKNIKGLLEWIRGLESIQGKKGDMVVALEGAFETIHPDYLDLFPQYPEVNEAIAADLFEKGELDGVELFAWEAYKKNKLEGFKVVGAEEPELYRENLRTYRTLLFHQDRIETLLTPFRSNLEIAKSRLLSPALNNFLRERQRRKLGNYENGMNAPQLSAYFSYLAGQAQKELQIDLSDAFEQVRFPNLVRILAMSRLEAAVRPDEARSQMLELAAAIGKNARSDEEKDLAARLEANNLNFTRPLAERVWKTAVSLGIDASVYGHFWKLAGFQILRSEIDARELFREAEIIENWLIGHWATDEKQQRLVEILNSMELVEKLLALKWTPEDHAGFLKDEARIREDFLGNALFEIAGEKSSLSEVNAQHREETGRFISAALRFYADARKRDEVLLGRALRQSEQGSKTILISGGFHTEGLTALMREKNISYAVIQPVITVNDGGALYHDVLEDKHADLSSYFDRPYLNKQESLFFKALIEKAAPMLWEKYGVEPARLGSVLADAANRHPVLSARMRARGGVTGRNSSMTVNVRPGVIQASPASSNGITSQTVKVIPVTESWANHAQGYDPAIPGVTTAGSVDGAYEFTVTLQGGLGVSVAASTVPSDGPVFAGASKSELRLDEMISEINTNLQSLKTRGMDAGLVAQVEEAHALLTERNFEQALTRLYDAAALADLHDQDLMKRIGGWVGVIRQETGLTGSRPADLEYNKEQNARVLGLDLAKVADLTGKNARTNYGATIAAGHPITGEAGDAIRKWQDELLILTGGRFRINADFSHATVGALARSQAEPLTEESFAGVDFDKVIEAVQNAGAYTITFNQIKLSDGAEGNLVLVGDVEGESLSLLQKALSEAGLPLKWKAQEPGKPAKVFVTLGHISSDVLEKLEHGQTEELVKWINAHAAIDPVSFPVNRLSVAAYRQRMLEDMVMPDVVLPLGQTSAMTGDDLKTLLAGAFDGSRSELRSWAEDNTPELMDYTIVERQFEAGLDEAILADLEERYGEEIANYVAQLVMTGGLGALMPDMIDGEAKNFAAAVADYVEQAAAKRGVDSEANVIGIHPLYTDKIKGLVKGLTPELLKGRKLGDYLEDVLEDTGIEFQIRLDVDENFRREAQGLAREVADRDLTVKVFKRNSSMSGAPNYYMKIFTRNAEDQEISIFNELYPDAKDYNNSTLWRDTQMGAYALASQILVRKLQEQGSAHENIIFADNELYTSLPTPLFPGAIHVHRNHTLVEAGLPSASAAAFSFLGYPQGMKKNLERNGRISLVDGVALTSDVIVGVSLYEHTPALEQLIFPAHLHKLNGYRDGDIRSTNGVLLDRWEDPNLRTLITTYREKLGLLPETVDKDFYEQLRVSEYFDEFNQRFEFIKAASVADFLVWMDEVQKNGVWLGETVRKIEERTGETILNPYETLRNYQAAVSEALENEDLWSVVLAEYAGIAEVLAEDPIVSNVRRQVSYKGPDKWIEFLESLLNNPDAIEDFRRNSARVVIGGREFGPDAQEKFNRIKQLIEQLGVQDRIATIENYSNKRAKTIFRAMSGVVMLADQKLEASATSMEKGLTSGAVLIGVWGGAMPELFTIVEPATGREVNVFEENVTYEQLIEKLDSGEWAITNGFLVRYSDQMSLERGGGWRPSSPSLKQALKDLREASRDASTRRRLRFDALASSYKVDIEKSQTRAQLFIMQEAVHQRKKIEEFLSSLSIPAEITRQIINPAEDDDGFGWTRKLYPDQDETVQIVQSAPGLLGFLNGFRELRMHGREAFWSIAYHATNTENDAFGDIFFYIFNVLKIDDPSLSLIKDDLLDLARRSADTDDIREKVEYNMVAFEILDQLAMYLSWNLLNDHLTTGKPEPMLKDAEVREYLGRYLDRYGKRLDSTSTGIRFYAVKAQDGVDLISVNYGEAVLPREKEAKAWSTLYGHESFVALLGKEALNHPERSFIVKDRATGATFKRYTVKELLTSGLPVGISADNDVQGLRFVPALDEQISELLTAAVREEFVGGDKLPSRLLIEEIQHLRGKPAELSAVLEKVADLSRAEAEKRFAAADGDKSAIGGVMALLALLAPDNLRYMRDWNRSTYDSLDSIISSPANRQLFKQGEVRIHRSSRGELIALSKTLNGRHIVLNFYPGKRPHRESDGKVLVRITNVDSLDIPASGAFFMIYDHDKGIYYPQIHRAEDLHRNGWFLEIPVINAPHYQFLEPVQVNEKGEPVSPSAPRRSELRETPEEFAKKVFAIPMDRVTEQEDIDFVDAVTDALRAVGYDEIRAIQPIRFSPEMVELYTNPMLATVTPEQRRQFAGLRKAMENKDQANTLLLLSLKDMSDRRFFWTILRDTVRINSDTGQIVNRPWVELIQAKLQRSELRKNPEAFAKEIRDVAVEDLQSSDLPELVRDVLAALGGITPSEWASLPNIRISEEFGAADNPWFDNLSDEQQRTLETIRRIVTVFDNSRKTEQSSAQDVTDNLLASGGREEEVMAQLWAAGAIRPGVTHFADTASGMMADSIIGKPIPYIADILDVLERENEIIPLWALLRDTARISDDTGQIVNRPWVELIQAKLQRSELRDPVYTQETVAQVIDLDNLTAEQRQAVDIVFDIEQQHLFNEWDKAGINEDRKAAYLQKIYEMNREYPEGLKKYRQNAKHLLEESKAGINPLDGFTPGIPDGVDIGHVGEDFIGRQDHGLTLVNKTAFVLVAGGMGERLGYDDIKISLPISLITNVNYAEWDGRNIQAYQDKSNVLNGENRVIPFVVMTSEDNDERTKELLASTNNVGLAEGQISTVTQGVVPALANNDADFVNSAADPYELETKPHGHGDVHPLLNKSGVVKQWKKDGVRRVVFIQDTNGQVFNAVLPLLSIAEEKGYQFAYITVPRDPGEKAGAITRLTSESAVLVKNVEYNLLEALLKATISPEGDVADPRTGLSPLPGNTNVFSIEIDAYDRFLDETGGFVSEFVNPKYADAARETFKEHPRVESMMQDASEEIDPARVGVANFGAKRTVFSPVKNKLEDAATKRDGMATGEADFYQFFRQVLAIAGADIDVEGKPRTTRGVTYSEGAKVVLDPSFAVTASEVKRKVRNVSVSDDSTLVIEGEGVQIDGLDLDGALYIHAVPGANIIINGLTVRNDGIDFVDLTDEEMADPEVSTALKIRGYKAVHEEQVIIEAAEPGDYILENITIEGSGGYRVSGGKLSFRSELREGELTWKAWWQTLGSWRATNRVLAGYEPERRDAINDKLVTVVNYLADHGRDATALLRTGIPELARTLNDAEIEELIEDFDLALRRGRVEIDTEDFFNLPLVIKAENFVQIVKWWLDNGTFGPRALEVIQWADANSETLEQFTNYLYAWDELEAKITSINLLEQSDANLIRPDVFGLLREAGRIRAAGGDYDLIPDEHLIDSETGELVGTIPVLIQEYSPRARAELTARDAAAVEGVLFYPTHKAEGLKNQTLRDPEEVLALLRRARDEGIELEIEANLRGVDGPGSSLDLPEFQRALTPVGAAAVTEIPSTPTIASEFSVKIRFSLAKNPDAIEYVAPDYNITEEKPDVVVGEVQLTPDGKTPRGQLDGPAYIFRNLFGLRGIRIELESISPMALAGGMESSNAFNVALFAAASMLAGADWSYADIFAESVRIENDEFQGLTGGQGHLASILGGSFHHVWLSGVKNADGEFVSEYGAFSRPFLDPSEFPFLEQHMALVQAGKDYQNGKALVGRAAALTNNMWTDLLRDRDPVGVELHSSKLELAARYVEALKNRDLKTVVEIVNRYVDIRDELQRRWLTLAMMDPAEQPEYARKYTEILETDETMRLYHEKFGDDLRNKSLYTDSLDPDSPNDGKRIILAAREKGIAIMPLGAGGPGANNIAIAQNPGDLEAFFEEYGLPVLQENEARKIIRGEVPGRVTLRGYIPFKIGKDPIRVSGFQELGLDLPEQPAPFVYDQTDAQKLRRSELREDLAFAERVRKIPVSIDIEDQDVIYFVQQIRAVVSRRSILDNLSALNQPVTISEELFDTLLDPAVSPLKDNERKRFFEAERTLLSDPARSNEALLTALSDVSNPAVFWSILKDTVRVDESGALANPEWVAFVREKVESITPESRTEAQSELRELPPAAGSPAGSGDDDEDLQELFFPAQVPFAATPVVKSGLDERLPELLEDVDEELSPEALAVAHNAAESIFAKSGVVAEELNISRRQALALVARQVMGNVIKDGARFAEAVESLVAAFGEQAAARILGTGLPGRNYIQHVTSKEIRDERQLPVLAFILVARHKDGLKIHVDQDPADPLTREEIFDLLKEPIEAIGGDPNIALLSLTPKVSDNYDQPSVLRSDMLASTEGRSANREQVFLVEKIIAGEISAEEFLRSFPAGAQFGRVFRELNFSDATLLMPAVALKQDVVDMMRALEESLGLSRQDLLSRLARFADALRRLESAA